MLYTALRLQSVLLVCFRSPCGSGDEHRHSQHRHGIRSQYGKYSIITLSSSFVFIPICHPVQYACLGSLSPRGNARLPHGIHRSNQRCQNMYVFLNHIDMAFVNIPTMIASRAGGRLNPKAVRGGSLSRWQLTPPFHTCLHCVMYALTRLVDTCIFSHLSFTTGSCILKHTKLDKLDTQ